MGDAGTSYLVGFGKGGAGYAQIMGASCPGLPVQGKAQVRAHMSGFRAPILPAWTCSTPSHCMC